MTEPASDVLETDALLATEQWGLRFVREETERAYGPWQVQHDLAVNRAAASTAVAVALAAALAMPVIVGTNWLPRAMVCAVGAAAAGLSLLPMSSSRGRAWIAPAVTAANLVTAGVGFTLTHVFVSLPGSAVALLALNTFYNAAIFRIGPRYVLAASLPAAAVESLAQAQLHRSGELDSIAYGSNVAILVAVLASALAASATNDRATRSAYVRERIIEQQKETIARERARSEELLKRELSHQVAERSRELGAVLAKSDVTLDVRALRTEERFAERYKIVAALGAGGMGAVYEVERVTDGAKLALKAVVGEVSGASAARFAREAEIGARIRHPNLISIVDVGVSSGVPFLVMELVRGGSLESQRANFGDVAWALPILRQIAEGLAALHEAGVVHRDLKPANVLLDGTTAKISDFGISRFGSIDEATADPNAATMAATPKKSAELTGTGVVMGTPLYMAPEGARSARALDASADVFAFGILAYEMLTGRSPFAVPAFVLAMAEQPIPTPAPIDDARVATALASAVLACVASDPAARPRARALSTLLA